MRSHHLSEYLSFHSGLIRLQLSAYRDAGGVQALINSNARNLAEQEELKLVATGIPYTVIRAGLLQSTPGGRQGFSFEQVLLFFFYDGQEKNQTTSLTLCSPPNPSRLPVANVFPVASRKHLCAAPSEHKSGCTFFSLIQTQTCLTALYLFPFSTVDY